MFHLKLFSLVIGAAVLSWEGEAQESSKKLKQEEMMEEVVPLRVERKIPSSVRFVVYGREKIYQYDDLGRWISKGHRLVSCGGEREKSVSGSRFVTFLERDQVPLLRKVLRRSRDTLRACFLFSPFTSSEIGTVFERFLPFRRLKKIAFSLNDEGSVIRVHPLKKLQELHISFCSNSSEKAFRVLKSMFACHQLIDISLVSKQRLHETDLPLEVFFEKILKKLARSMPRLKSANLHSRWAAFDSTERHEVACLKEHFGEVGLLGKETFQVRPYVIRIPGKFISPESLPKTLQKLSLNAGIVAGWRPKRVMDALPNIKTVIFNISPDPNPYKNWIKSFSRLAQNRQVQLGCRFTYPLESLEKSWIWLLKDVDLFYLNVVVLFQEGYPFVHESITSHVKSLKLMMGNSEDKAKKQIQFLPAYLPDLERLSFSINGPIQNLLPGLLTQSYNLHTLSLYISLYIDVFSVSFEGLSQTLLGLSSSIPQLNTLKIRRVVDVLDAKPYSEEGLKEVFQNFFKASWQMKSFCLIPVLLTETHLRLLAQGPWRLKDLFIATKVPLEDIQRIFLQYQGHFPYIRLKDD